MKYKTLAINKEEGLIFGKSINPVEAARGIKIGAGKVYPELNFTLPPMKINTETLNDVKQNYRGIITDALNRAKELGIEELIFEFETLLEMTLNPEIGVELVTIMNDICEDYYQKYGIKSAIRLTPNDTREFDRPPKMRSGKYINSMIELFERGAEAGGDLLSIESTGGKEICDDALMMCNIQEVIFALSVLGVRDMHFLWEKIVSIAKMKNKIPGGDTACGFGNTAMVLADKNYIPKVFSAIVRIVTVIRSLVAYEEGAKGPGKDCGYENVFIKAIAGVPISMEGKSAACAHMSPLGNIAAACCDLWSNESVQNVRLLGGMAPTVSLEQLEYDTRLLNQATIQGNDTALILRNLLVQSDMYRDPQALILAPENVIEISNEIIKGRNYVDATNRGAKKGLEIIREAIKQKKLIINEKEVIWIDKIQKDIEELPDDEDKLIEFMLPKIDKSKVFLEEYGL